MSDAEQKSIDNALFNLLAGDYNSERSAEDLRAAIPRIKQIFGEYGYNPTHPVVSKNIFCICDDKGTLCPVHNTEEFARVGSPVDDELNTLFDKYFLDAEELKRQVMQWRDAHLQAAVKEAEIKAALQALMSLDIDTESSAGKTIDAEITRLRNKL